jgi:hypothetical protein
MSISVDTDKQSRLESKDKRLWNMMQAKQDHEAEQAEVRSRTLRLRALRLAEEAKNPPSQKPKRRAKASVKS